MQDLEKTLLSSSGLVNFFAEYDRIQRPLQKRFQADIAEFFEVYKVISEKHVSRPSVTDELTPNFTSDLYQSFFSKFEPLFLNEKRRGAEINVWSESGLKQDEVRNTAVLAWWLDCNGSHGLGDLLLKALLGALTTAEMMPPISTINNDYRVKVESLPMGERENRIDIELSGPDFLIFIEVKINAGEGDQQINRYQELIKKKAESYGMHYSGIVFLTRYAGSKNNERDCIGLSWGQLAHSFRVVNLPSEATFSHMLLKQFCDHIDSF